jgi:hypothetical protein
MEENTSSEVTQNGVTLQEGFMFNHQFHSIFSSLVCPITYVGDVYALSYGMAWVQMHDYYQHQVGGIPQQCFLIATRLADSDPQLQPSDNCSFLLLRVLSPALLPTHVDAERVRVEVAQRVVGDLTVHWDDSAHMDATTHHVFSFSGLQCRILGTFSAVADDEGRWFLSFGSDVPAIYANRGLKVYKPCGPALAALINPGDSGSLDTEPYRITIGEVRYTSTMSTPLDAPVVLTPIDLIGQKTAVFGMTRTGKSNTTKILSQSVFGLRFAAVAQRVGQIVFDAHGEYTNDNLQDIDSQHKASSLRQVWRMNQAGRSTDVVTYGLVPQPHDPHRCLMLLNFLDESNLSIGKHIIDDSLAGDSAKFIQHFRQVPLLSPDTPSMSQGTSYGARKRYERHVLVYRTLLVKAGFTASATLVPKTRGLFNTTLLAMMESNEGDNADCYKTAAAILRQPQPSWAQLGVALSHLATFMSDRDSGYAAFESSYVRSSSTGEAWADETLHKLMTMFRYPNGVRQLGRAAHLHTSTINSDYAQTIYDDLVQGKLVLVDQSVGDPETNSATAERIMQVIFQGQQARFRSGRDALPLILIYLEEAHTLLPAGSDQDLSNIWVRVAKEGAKYQLGMVYATQEVSSIQRNIVKNTTNWFIGHLNNADEIRELCKYEDFADFEEAIRRVTDRGFVRMKTISNRFTVPVQIRKFELEG